MDQSTERLAYSVGDLSEAAQIGRTKAFAEIASGRLRARKIGRRTIVLAEDLADYLAALPEASASEGPAAR